MAAGAELPKQVLVHSHWLSEGVKMSKSLGNVVDPFALAENYGTDPTRFYLMENASISNDCKFSEREIQNSHASLVNKWANICSRVGGEKFNLEQSVKEKEAGTFDDIEQVISLLGSQEYAVKTLELWQKLAKSVNSLYTDMNKEMRHYGQMKALQRWWETVELGNEFFQHCEPWRHQSLSTTADANRELHQTFASYAVYLCAEAGRVTSICVSPFMPDLASKFLGSRRRIVDDDDDDIVNNSGLDNSPQPRRARRHVSYTEDSDDKDNLDSDRDSQESKIKDVDSPKLGEADLSDGAPLEPDNENKDGNYDENFSDEDEEIMPSRKRARKAARRAERPENEDSDFKADDVSDDEHLSEPSGDESDFLTKYNKLREKQFVATDEEDDSIHNSSRMRRSKSRSRRDRLRSEPLERRPKRRLAAGHDDDDGADDLADDDSIQQEINDLYDSSPDASPIKHKLRERERKIDYTIPSLITNENENELYAAAQPSSQLFRSRGRRPPGNKSEFRNLLFPTAGPFGGSDVVSLMGQNIPPGGIPIPGMTSGPNLSMALGNDSDSSDEDFAPIAGNQGMPGSINQVPGLTNTQAKDDFRGGSFVNNTNIRGAQLNEKKKNSLSDTDPLGVDMNIDFSAVGGLDNYIDQLKEMVALPLLYPELYQNFSITPPRGVLFHGPPGTGKTLMARALAASCSTPSRKITFFMRKGADCLSKWVGEAERQLRLLFEEAKNQQPSIIFFDEIDGLAPVRSSKQEQIHASIVSTLLALMDGMDNRGQVIVIGATNRPDSVDPALRRPGRFDREFYFPLPDLNARKQILQIHTKHWNPPLSLVFVEKIAGLTKGYGGADMRALCTEAALNSIQRKYPQIYKSSEKLMVKPSKVKVVAKDFMRAIEKIVPSSARSTSTGSSPLPERLLPLLQEPLDEVARKLNDLLPGSVGSSGRNKMTNLEEAMYLDPTINDEDGGFSKHEFLRNLENSRICKPHLLVCGERGAGQQYLGSAILNLLEGFQVQNLDLATIFSDVTRTPELCIVQAFTEARRHQPSIIFISNIDTWFEVMPHSAKATLAGLLRNLRSNERILLLGIAEKSHNELDHEMKIALGFLNGINKVDLVNPPTSSRKRFFINVKNALLMKPFEFLNDLENRPKRKLKVLKPAPLALDTNSTLTKKRIKQQEYEDTKLKNILKLKLAAIMDLFKNRYKRFKKPIIDDALLHHLFEPSVLENPHIPYEVLYVKGEGPEHAETIKEVATGKHFYNMDLDTIEERIWNGFYSEAKQFMRDIRMIVKDAITSGDRERILKANEMLTNAQFGIEDFNNAEFSKACKLLREREVEKQEKLLAEYHRLKKEFEQKQQELLLRIEDNPQSSYEIQKPISPNPNLNGGFELNGKSAQDVSTAEVNDSAHQHGSISAREADSNLPIDTERENLDLVGKEISPGDKSFVDSVNETDSESEAEDGYHVETDRHLILPDDLDTLFEDAMVKATNGFTIEKLEYFVARLMEIIWEDRSQWNKIPTVAKLKSETDKILI
ncbi:AAA-domain-containing protein [Metschnikowia bicuspidata var. bicuspidata NRRL YB-4993]|uniref:AAA-domain-containing protein n=1 Tax=Metschnikowia bicuspidata var. bicuspidata NRRL YB-4993 TaxID=869754 RepID=A0A1A0H5Q1_9ASCO|nr:AAA-domain-containing protein [Metschnikowia bicuspidata var. bicuspidata NRRL YB-4993]OBA19361.1 AAA-domain-containing protein [Metschnikowia bicuspidata var. bicuspidata NRRL YB-4993]